MPSQKCPYHVTFDLDVDLEHTLDARSLGDHRVQNVYRETDRQTTDATRLYGMIELTNRTATEQAIPYTLARNTHEVVNGHCGQHNFSVMLCLRTTTEVHKPAISMHCFVIDQVVTFYRRVG